MVKFSIPLCYLPPLQSTVQLLPVGGGVSFPIPRVWAVPEICLAGCSVEDSTPPLGLGLSCAQVNKPRLASRMVRDMWSGCLLALAGSQSTVRHGNKALRE